jgi:hypothetical protein
MTGKGHKEASRCWRLFGSLIPSFVFFFLWYWDLNSGPSPWALHQPFLVTGFFQDRVSITICKGWLQTLILLISAFWVTRTTVVSHQCPAWIFFTNCSALYKCKIVCVYPEKNLNLAYIGERGTCWSYLLTPGEHFILCVQRAKGISQKYWPGRFLAPTVKPTVCHHRPCFGN